MRVFYTIDSKGMDDRKKGKQRLARFFLRHKAVAYSSYQTLRMGLVKLTF